MSARAYRELPGLGGVPYRHYSGDPEPMFRTSDPMSEQPVMRKQMHSRVFDLSDEKQRAQYDEILTSVVDRREQFRLSTENIQWCEKKGAFIAFLRWEERWLERAARPPRAVIGTPADDVYTGEKR